MRGERRRQSQRWRMARSGGGDIWNGLVLRRKLRVGVVSGGGFRGEKR